MNKKVDRIDTFMWGLGVAVVVFIIDQLIFPVVPRVSVEENRPIVIENNVYRCKATEGEK